MIKWIGLFSCYVLFTSYFFRYKAENARRRHNYLPFLMELLKCLAKEGKLVPLMEQAQEIAVRRAKKSES